LGESGRPERYFQGRGEANPEGDSTTPFQSDRKKIDSLADDMAAKAGKVEHQSEKNSDPVGGVSSNSGGLFTK
jgi:hypothetical protein